MNTPTGETQYVISIEEVCWGALLMTLAQDFQDQQMQLLKQKRERRQHRPVTRPSPAAGQPQ
jgi:hypothetical protein